MTSVNGFTSTVTHLSLLFEIPVTLAERLFDLITKQSILVRHEKTVARQGVPVHWPLTTFSAVKSDITRLRQCNPEIRQNIPGF